MWIEAGDTAEEREAIRQECEDEMDSDLKRSGKQLRELEQSTSDSALELGNRYLIGNEVEEDRFEAVRCFKRAAGLGNMKAQTQLGMCYLNGCGAIENSFTAMSWFEKAAAQGCSEAKFQLGLGLAYGRGVGADSNRAQKCFLEASAELPEAMFMLRMTDIRWRYPHECPREDILDDLYEAAKRGNANAISIYVGYLSHQPLSGRHAVWDDTLWKRALLFVKGLELPEFSD